MGNNSFLVPGYENAIAQIKKEIDIDTKRLFIISGEGD